ncbi:MAG: ice-binding family protein [Bellilinea sp.]
MHKRIVLAISIIVVLTLSMAGLSQNVSARPLAATAPSLGAANSFSVLGFAAVTNTNTTNLSGDLGVWSGTSITGLESIIVGGAVHQTDPVAQQAQADASAADLNLTGQANSGGSLGALDSLVVGPGVYDLGAGSLGGGVLTLDGEGVYIFRTTSDLTTAGSVSLINGAAACDVFWHVATQANLVSGSFVGTIIAGTGIVFGTGVSLDGRALAIGGPVTMDTNTITGPSCVRPAPTTPTETPAATSETTEATATLLPAVAGLPSTGGGPIRNDGFPWSLVVLSGISATALIVSIRAMRRTNQAKK